MSINYSPRSLPVHETITKRIAHPSSSRMVVVLCFCSPICVVIRCPIFYSNTTSCVLTNYPCNLRCIFQRNDASSWHGPATTTSSATGHDIAPGKLNYHDFIVSICENCDLMDMHAVS